MSQRMRRQAGFSLIELMIALIIALFVVGGLASLYVAMKISFRSQDQFAQLEDSQRLASTMLSQTVRSAGYFPDPQTLTLATALPAVTGSFAAGQAISGTAATDTTAEVMTVRYVTKSGDTVMNCLGQANANASGTTQLQTNAFKVDSAGKTLTCSVNGGDPVAIVSGVSSMAILYCVDTNAGAGAVVGPTRYLGAADVGTLGLWSSVYAVKVTLQFVNPLAGQTGQPDTLPWVVIASLMAKV